MVESMSSDDVTKFHFQMYRPDPNESPTGFDEDDQLGAFDAFASATAGLS